MKTGKLTLVAVLVFVLHSVQSESVHAQVAQKPQGKQLRSYQPSRPTFSPYLQLLRRDTGPLPNYQFFYQPRVYQQSVNQRQQSNVRQLQQEVTQLENPQFTTGAGSGFRTSQTKFRNSRAYFQSHQTNQPRR